MDKKYIADKARLMHLEALSLSRGMKSGAFRSLYKGQGIEFNGVREYFAGDDVRSIDWNVTARMGRPYVKTFEEERELDVFIILDVSASMKSGIGKRTKIQTAVECASLLTLAACQNANPVGAVVFDGGIRFSSKPLSGFEHAQLLLSRYEKACSRTQTGSALDNAILGADRLLKKRSLVMIFSDFRTSAWLEPFGRLGQKNDVVAVCISDTVDERLPEAGAVPFTDPESGIRMILPTSSSKFKSAWNDANYHRIETWKHECMRRGGIPLQISTSSEPVVELTRFFASREIQ